MAKQVLSVADFATILKLVDSEITQVEYMAKHRNKDIFESQYYLNLKHLKESLQNLNIEVETPDVDILFRKDLKKVLPKGIKWKCGKVGEKDAKN